MITNQEIKNLAEAIHQYLEWRERVFQLKEAERQERFRKAYLRRLAKRKKTIDNKDDK